MSADRRSRPGDAGAVRRRRFEPVLRSLAERLDLPQPAKARTLIEIAGDLEDLYRHHRDHGLDQAAAHAAALDRFDLSDAALRELAAVHASRLRCFMDGLSQRGRTGVERASLASLLLFVAVVGWRQLAVGGFLEHVGVVAGLAALFALAAVGFAAARAARLWLVHDHDLRTLRRGLGELLVAAVGGLIVGTIGFWLQIYRAAVALARSSGATAPDVSAVLLLGVRRAFADATVGMFCALLCCLLWWLLSGKATRIEYAETQYLMEI